MKYLLKNLFLLILSSVLLISCEKTVTSEPNKIVLNKKSLEIIKADQKFAFELFREVNSLSGEENLMISPLSVSYALGMTYNGAAGETLEAFNKVLHFEELTRTEVNESYKDLMGQLISLDDRIEFSIANGIWYVDWAEVLDSFIINNQNYFDAAVQAIDFSDPGSVDIINSWIEDKTNNKIKDMLDAIPGDAYMYLVNAIYFNATWKYEFEPKDTYSGIFYSEEDSEFTADFMRVEEEFFYAMTEEFSGVELPYGDGAFSMVIMLPTEDKTLNELIDVLDEELWEKWTLNSAPATVTVEIPKFKYVFKELLNNSLKNLGLGIAFSDSAEFPLITEQVSLFISRVIHQTFIDVNEKGTEAAAATIVEMRYESAIGNYFRADRPFVYVIKENSTGAILFIGKVGKPVYE